MSRKTAMKTKERLDKLEGHLASCLELSKNQCNQNESARKIIEQLKDTIELYDTRLENVRKHREEDDICWMDYVDREYKRAFINGMLTGAWALVLALIVVSLLI